MDISFLKDSTQILRLPARFDSLLPINEFVTAAAKAAGLNASAVYAVQLAVDEAFTNIIEHAYGGEGHGEIECTCRINFNGLTVILRDHGRPFDPTNVPEPDLTAGLESRQKGGLGIYFMRHLMDEVHFEFSLESGNVLTMVKRKEAVS